MRTPYDRPEETSSHEREPENVRTILKERYERCAFCNSKLMFSHDLNLSFLQVVETSRCAGCGVTMNPKKFTLQ
jgi:hypothetical protein